ncbi:MAG TPA: PQQ-dependent dehydrogenase, methanol/ethanol family [Vicinamibacterales bacterium]|nr:PQQ-dependent dehydrogenase, methanol/ethanol family [Vicinamibacterales bacterium]
MARPRRGAAFAVVAGVLGAGLAISARQAHVATTSSNVATEVTGAVLRRAGTSADPLPGSWLSYGRGHAETRYSPLKEINTTNAKDLGLAWSYVMGAGGGNQEGTPLMWNNTLYGITTWSVVFALDARTGRELWRWDPDVNQTTVRPVICCGNVNRGIALFNGMIIAPSIDGRLFALNALTGKPIWETRVVYPNDLYTLTMAPRIAGGRVIIGASGGDKTTRGQFVAVDAQTGQLAWRFYTVPGDPSKPFESEALRRAAKTWGGDYYKYGGGGAVWDGFAYDPDANMVYVGTGNAQPWVQKFRGAQGLDNLYTCAILAVDLTTGQLKWHYQTVPNDNWDYDNVQQLMLFDLPIGGRTRKVITQAPKNGFFYVLDRVTGEFLSAEPFVKVSWALRMGKDGRPVVNPAAYYDQEPISVFPTGGGGHNWSPMSYNPATGLVYIPASYQSFPYQAQAEYRPGSTGYVRPQGATKTIEPSFGPEPPAGARNGLQAWDPVNQKLRWNVAGGGGIGGGTTTTAGNLVFQVINDGRFRAISADKGEILYEVQTNRTGMAPPITYEVDGKQYVAFGGGLGRAASVLGPTNASVENAPMMFVFTLGGKAELPAPAPTASPAPDPATAAGTEAEPRK